MLLHKLREAMAEEMKGRVVGGARTGRTSFSEFQRQSYSAMESEFNPPPG
jgi:hypothetical protein